MKEDMSKEQLNKYLSDIVNYNYFIQRDNQRIVNSSFKNINTCDNPKLIFVLHMRVSSSSLYSRPYTGRS